MPSKLVIIDQGQMRARSPGDIVFDSKVFPAATTANNETYTPQRVLGAYINRTPTAASADVMPTSALIVGQTGYLEQGTTFEFDIVNNSAFAITLTSGTGTTVANGTVNALSVKHVLCTVVNGSPQVNLTADITSGSPVLTNIVTAQLQGISVGMLMTTVVGGFTSPTIVSIQQGPVTSTITLSANATVTTAARALIFMPVISVQGISNSLL